MNRFVLKNTLIKIYLYHFLINIFFKKNKKLKLDFGDRDIVQNNLFYGYEWSTYYIAAVSSRLTSNREC